jgi:cell wall-associated NlpC family hydrolase
MNRRRHRAGRGLVVAVALAMLPAVLPTTASADPISDQKALVAQVADHLEELQAQSDQLAEDYAEAMTRKGELDAEVATAEQHVAEQKAAVEALRGQLSEVAVQAYMGAGTGGTSPVFNSTAGVTDSLARDQLSRVALSTGTATTDEYDQAVADLEQEQGRLGDARQAAADTAKQITSTKTATDQQATEYTKARQDAEAKLGQLVQEEEERRARESYLKLQREAEEAAARQRAEAEAAAAAQQQAQAAADQQAQAAAQQQEQQQQQSRQQERAASAPAATAPATRNEAPAARNEAPAVEAVAVAVAEPDPEPVAIPAASSRAGTAIQAALSVLGVPYVGYKASPSEGFDCSGLTMWAWAQAGVSLPHYSKAQYESLPHVPKDQAQPGDLLFFHSPISHVSMYLGDGQQVSSPHTGAVVYVGSVNWGQVVGVARPG